MNKKLEFGCYYLHVMRALELRNSEEKNLDLIADAAARFFLLQWGFTLEECSDANKLFWERSDAGALPTEKTVVDRIVKLFKNDRPSQEKLIIQMAAISALNMNVSDAERMFVTSFLGLFDMKPAEFQILCERGEHWAVGLDIFGTVYLKMKGGKQDLHK